jgi:peptidylprolyl isomerase
MTKRVRTKSDRRAAAKAYRRERAARAAAAKRRRQALLGAGAALAVVVVLVGAYLLLREPGDGNPAAAPQVRGSATTATGFPPLPAGADPALGTKPSVGPGTGELTQLKVTTLVAGTGPATQTGQTVTVNYVGVSYGTGEEFDSSWKNQRPLPFQLGTGGVIRGWDQGLAGVNVGSRVQLDIPADLAYGQSPQPGFPAGPLRFVVDVLSAK